MHELLTILLGQRLTNSRIASCVAAACWRADPRATMGAAEDHMDVAAAGEDTKDGGGVGVEL